MGDSGESRLRVSSASAAAAVWAVNQRTEDQTLRNSAFQTKKYIILSKSVYIWGILEGLFLQIVLEKDLLKCVGFFKSLQQYVQYSCFPLS